MKVKVNKRLISAAAVALLLAAPVVSWDLSSQIKNDMQAEAIVWPWEKWRLKLEQTGEPCEEFIEYAKGSKTGIFATIKYDDHGSDRCRYRIHCAANYGKNFRDHEVILVNKKGKTKRDDAKCGKTASATHTCDIKTKISAFKCSWEGYDERNEWFHSGKVVDKKKGTYFEMRKLEKGKMWPW